MRKRLVVLVLAIAIVAASCSSSTATSDSSVDDEAPGSDTTVEGQGEVEEVDRSKARFGPAPESPDGDVAPEVLAAVEGLAGEVDELVSYGPEGKANLETIGASNDPRLAWLLSDLIRLSDGTGRGSDAASAAEQLVPVELSQVSSTWGELTDHLIAWDIPAPPNYLTYKRNLYIEVVAEWEPLFEDGRDVDWRYVSWGGVGIDNRPFDTTDDPCSCIPAADNPETSSADEAEWLDDGDIIFGVEIGGETRAYPRQILEVREMVNDTLGGRDFAMPYCTLCGSAQVFLTDQLPDGVDRPVLRTSGLLTRSNKVMYDVVSGSVFDTFRGDAVTGPLADQELVLNQETVVTTTWGEWKADHPDTTVLIEDLALGRDFDFRNNRDATGPIFPIGDLDQRLGVHDDVVGVITEDSGPIAFPVQQARAALDDGDDVTLDGVTLAVEAGGLVATDAATGDTIPSHQAFWFAWSQFHPDTQLWTP